MNHQSQKTKPRYILLAVSFLAFSGVSMVHAQPWEQVHKFLASDGAANDNFGNSVAVNGNITVIGANQDTDNGNASGSAYVFDATTGQQLFKLLPSDGMAGDQFGNSVAISDNLALIGVPYDDDIGTDSGSAYVFDVTTGQQIFKLLASDGAAKDAFGRSVAISGNLAVIGAGGADGNVTDSGSAYVFDIATGRQLTKLMATDGITNDGFGGSVAISGNLAVIGAFLDDDFGTSSGSAYIFNVSTGQQIFKIHASDEVAFDSFGERVAIDGNIVVIGVYRDNNQTGSAYVFDATTGQQIYKLLASDGATLDQFGRSIAVSGDLAVIGASTDDNDNGDAAGSVYVFDVTTGQQLLKLLATDGADYDIFGESVAINGNLAVIGAPRDDDNGDAAGSAYIFQPQTLTITPTPLIAKQHGTFTITRSRPDQLTWLIYSLDGLQKIFIRQLNVVIDLANPQIAVGPRRTDANGDLQLILPMPGILSAVDVWFQAVQQRNVTNFVATQVVP